MAKLLLEIKGAVECARGQGSAVLADEQLADFEGRYDRIVKRGLEINPPPHQKKPRAGPSGESHQKPGRVAQTLARNLVARLERNKPEILRFMHDFAVPFDNNLAERDIRMVKLQQKIGGSFRAQDGAREFCRIRSYISSCLKLFFVTLPARVARRAAAGPPPRKR
jgi:transposase